MDKQDLAKIDFTNLFNSLQRVKLDVYLQLSEDKFVRIIHSKSDEREEVLRKYHEKGVRFFFVKKQFIHEIKNQLLDNLEKNIHLLNEEESSQAQKIKVGQSLVKELRSLVKSLGASQEVTDATEKAVQAVYELSKETVSLEAMLEVIQGKGEYIQKHGLLCSFITCAVARQFSWATEDLIQSFILASLFQDISLDSDRLAKIFDKGSKEFKKLDSAQKEVVINHTSYSAIMLEAISKLSSEAQRLIRNHHENPQGTGFLGRLNSGSTGPIDACFIISVRFSHELIRNQPLTPEAIRSIVHSMNKSYNVGNYKNIYKQFIEVFESLKV